MNSGRVSAVFVAGWMKTIELKAISGQLRLNHVLRLLEFPVLYNIQIIEFDDISQNES